MNSRKRTFHPLIWGVPAAMLLFAVLPLPYGYYQFLRLVVFTSGVFLAWVEFSRFNRINPSSVLFGMIALLMNPFLPVHLQKEIWIVLNLFMSAAFIWHKAAVTPQRA